MDAAKTVGGWLVVIGGAAAFYWVTNRRTQKTRRTVVPKSTGKVAEPRKEPKAKKTKKDGGSDQDVKQSQKKKAAQPEITEEKAFTSAVDDKGDDEVDNREFARQLQNAKSGTVMASKGQTSSSRPKSVKQTHALEKPIENSSDNATAPSSTAGVDADDDESPLNSPELAATAINGDVSDMLEKPAGGPQVLKITSPTNPTPAKKAKTPKPAETKETKKQRQNRQKAEAQRLAREEEEKERKVLEEKQRRTAREAEGRAAKDGSAFMASKAPSSSAWTGSATNGTTTTTGSKVELLDTYEPSKSNGNGVKSSEVVGSQLANDYNGLSEEEQIRIIQEESADWKTVSKEKRKKKNPAKETVESKEEKQADIPETQEFGIPPVIAPTGPGQAWSMKTVHVEPETRKVIEREIEVQDSEWEVA
jgi:hypothetical protein